MKVLMIGATGTYASLIVPELNKRGIKVRALLRDESQADAVLKIGVEEIAIGDLMDPKSLQTAAKGADGVFHLNPAFAPHEAQMGINMVKAAQAARVHKFVFSSVYHPSLPLINHAAKQAVEAALYESNMEYTILQPAMFMQNLAGSWKTVLKQGKISMPYSKLAKVCYVDYCDVAEVVARAFHQNTLANGTFELSAQGMVNRVEIAAMMSEFLDKKVVAEEIPLEEWAQKANMSGQSMKDGLMKMFKHYHLYGFHGGNDLVLKAILGREPRTLRAYIEELATHSTSESGKI